MIQVPADRAGGRPSASAASTVWLTPPAAAAADLVTLFQPNSEDTYRGRVFAALSTVEGITVLAGTLGAGYLSRFAGIIPVLANPEAATWPGWPCSPG